MKTILVVLFAFVCCGEVLSQTLPNYESVKTGKGANSVVADSVALECASALLFLPYDANDPARLNSLKYLIRWMADTPDYQFSVDGTAEKISKENINILPLYMAAMSKYCLENKASSKDPKLVKLNAIKLLLFYCETPTNNIKMTKELKKLSQANEKGTLEKYLE